MNAATPGDRYRVFVLFTLSGAALGVLLAMLFFTTPNDGFGRTAICFSSVLTICTTLVGWAVGYALSTSPGPARGAITAGVLLLTGLLGAAVGWLVGDALAADPDVPDRRLIAPGVAAAVGGLIGLPAGVLVLASRWLRRARS